MAYWALASLSSWRPVLSVLFISETRLYYSVPVSAS